MRKPRAGRSQKSSSSTNMDHSFNVKYVPPEIWRHILAYLPVKTLLRFRCVCKSWCSIIEHPDFVYALKRHKLNSNTSQIFAIQPLNLRCHGIEGCSVTNRQGDTLQKTAHIFQSSHSYCILGSCNELFLMGRDFGGNSEGSYFRKELWNPSIRKSLLLPPCPGDDATSLFGFAFGFAPQSKDYKIVALSYSQCLDIEEPGEICLAVYTLSNQQWTIRNNALDISCSDIYSMFHSDPFPPRAFYFDGAAHWIGGRPGYLSAHLVSFNFDSENFSFIEFPAASDEIEPERFLFLLEESFALLSISPVSFRIWVLEQGVWTNWFSRCSTCDDYDFFYKRSTLLNIVYHESCDGKFFLFWDVSYNISTGRVREHEKSERSSTCFDLGVYTESLVLLKGYGAENMASLP